MSTTAADKLLTDPLRAEATATRTRPVRVEIILNASAGSGDQEAARRTLTEIFAAESDLEAHVSLARSGEEIVALARRAVADKDVQIVVAGGGDGTVNAVATELVGTDKTLGVLPLGTLNHFAKDLNIPLDLEGAARNLITGEAARVDVGEVNERIFINNSSLGLYPSIVRHREKQQERLGRGKWFAAVWATLEVFRRYPLFSVRLSADGEEFSRRTPFVFIGNNEYQMDAFNLGARSCLDAGQLSLHLTRDIGRWGLVRLALSALLGRLRESGDFDALCTKEVWIATRRTRLRVATDGEVNIMRSPLHYRVRPGALRVITPRRKDEDEG
ncbi:MAG TPA: diacylglycerol kinase family protein [Pyrinomonadaceae bacterium]|jgi:diacylglycerol kinase family enzyme|nr:diacylglycerol kinase family protein [Pyrinomonadaceae bacterium]